MTLDSVDALYHFVVAVLVTLGFVYLASGVDDLFIDLVAFFARLAPKKLSFTEIRSLHTLPEKCIAITIPAWEEGHIIERMLLGNLQGIDYENYHIFVGVYPNDPLTMEAVKRVQSQFPRVHAVVNLLPGPTSKGQILNRVIQAIKEVENNLGKPFDAFLMQDAEDLIHPKALKLVNAELEVYDFVQIPVFSLEVAIQQLVAGTYIDEFAESHTKDILVRNFMGGAVPSAGVGTALKRNLVDGMLSQQGGFLFNERSVTEDYELGIRTHAQGFKPHFACTYYNHRGKKEFIATREFFPKRFGRSVRQKTRWTLGIALQGWRNLGWRGNLASRYFLFRDRKGLLTNISALLGYVFFLIALLIYPHVHKIHEDSYTRLFLPLLSLNTGLMGLRFFQRCLAVYRIYGMNGVWPVFFRWPVASTINGFACVMAVKRHTVARLTNKTIQWVKTEHELPRFFGTTGFEGAS